MNPEFSRIERLDTIGPQERAVAIEANEAERESLARRFALMAVQRLAAFFAIRREGGAVLATGRVEAAVIQACSVTGEPISATVHEAVALRFAEDDAIGEDVELSADALDTMPIAAGAIDLGEAAAETMALALDPFPRGPAAATALREAGVLAEGDAGPFGGLASLKAKLTGGG